MVSVFYFLKILLATVNTTKTERLTITTLDPGEVFKTIEKTRPARKLKTEIISDAVITER